MPANYLQNRQKRDVADVIEEEGFDYGDFTWRPPDQHTHYPPGDVRGNPHDKLVHRPSRYFFTFAYTEDQDPGRQARDELRNHTVEFSPAPEVPERKIYHVDWDGAMEWLRTWLGVLHEEYTTPDPWEQLSASEPEGLLPSGAREIPEGEPFSPEEKEAVRQRLDELEQEFRSYRDLTDEQLEALRSEIDALRDELDRMDKWRWARFAVGTSFSLIDLLGLDPAQAAGSVRDLLEFVASLPDQLPPGLS